MKQKDFEDSGFGFTSMMNSASKYVPRCYESHPPLPVGKNLFIHGGSCNHPSVKDADIYIGFDYGMQRTRGRFPWEPP